MENKRLVWPDFLRIISIFCVIIIHVTSVGLRDYEFCSSVWTWSAMLNSMCRWAVPVFFMISGMFFLDPKRQFDIKKFFKKNVLRIVLCIVVWGLLYSFLDQYLYGTISLKSILIAIYGILTDNTGYHLWFLYFQLILYISTPFLRIFTEHACKKQLDYAIVIWFILTAVFPMVNALSNELIGLPTVISYGPVAIAGYGGYYLLGYRLKKYPLEKKGYVISLIVGILSFVSMPIGNLLLSIRNGSFRETFTNPLGICCCLFSIALFSLVSRWNLKSKWISWVGQRVFGVYLVHAFFVSLTFHIFRLRLDLCFPPLSIFIYSVSTFCVSLFVSWLFSLIPALRKVV